MALFGKKKQDDDISDMPDDFGGLDSMSPPGGPTMPPPSGMSIGSGGLPPLPMAPAPSMGRIPKSTEEPIKLLTEDLEEISEAIITEKWKVLTKDLDKIAGNINSTTSIVERLQERMEELDKKMTNLENAVFGKVDEYGKGIKDVNVELKAMQKVFQTMMPTFAENVKELQGIIDKAKRKKNK